MDRAKNAGHAKVLNSPRAIATGVYVVRVFVRLRALLSSNKELARKVEELERDIEAAKAISAGISDRMSSFGISP